MRRIRSVMTIVTRTGDKGTTGLFGGQRVSKTDTRIEAYGTVDELNASLGAAVALGGVSDAQMTRFVRTQNVLFRLGADLATPQEGNNARVPRIGQEHVAELEDWITDLEQNLPPLRAFVLPGGDAGAALLHLARTICRRAERQVVALREAGAASAETAIYLNRLSDYLFLAALRANKEAGVEDVEVKYE